MLSPGIPIERAGGSTPSSMSPPLLQSPRFLDGLRSVFYKYFSFSLSPLFGFAAVKQEDQAERGRVLIFN
jgi:hypothetical protein